MARTLNEIAAEEHRILNPLTEAGLIELAEAIGVRRGTCVLDLGCGKGELLCRWAQAYGARGVGVDRSEVYVAAARSRAAELGVADRVRIGHGEAAAYHVEPHQYHAAVCLHAASVGGGVAGTIELLRPAVRDDGLLLIGTPFWPAEPPPDSPYPGLDGLLDVFDGTGHDLVELVAADQRGWDRWVAGQWWTTRAWLDAHPDDEAAAGVREQLRESRRRYLTRERGRLDWAVFVLRALQ